MGSIKGHIRTAKALRYHGQRDLRVEDLPISAAPLKEGQIRLRTAWCGICGTDVHEYLNGPVFPPMPAKPHPLTGEHMPITLGHEFSGVVFEVHPSVTRVKPGDKVAVEPLITDNTCYACSINKRNICDNSTFLGLNSTTGGLCEEVVVPASTCHVLPANVSLELGAMVEPLSVAWHAVSNSGIAATHSALVLGAGPIGLAVILCLQAKGIQDILVSEPSQARNNQAKMLGVQVLNPMEEDAVVKSKERFNGSIGPDYAFDASGIQATLDTGLKAVRKNGIHYNIALWGKKPVIDMNELLFNGKTLKSDLSYARGDYEAVIQAMADGRLSADSLQLLITGKIDLEDTEEKGIQELINVKDKHIKILVRVDKSLSK
ncbi:GroES-like protein [Melanomma pulvis-pyrius CBS 109.77]|uniref:GroES-like protein n=1 Tax=Melanomma pulvis-pyrius CBS 109.77 TaxID=1314802 RepID=A0A6A6WWH9_9PLEO|nr:GroES-like protein [Melanomma pulvis-pyrius CBS 109.77]